MVREMIRARGPRPGFDRNPFPTMKLKPLREQVIVITGASSGIGLATARAAAHEGARLVLFSRNEDALKTIVDEINAREDQAIHVTGDVARREDLERAADAAIARFGGFDTWINNAGVSLYGRLEEASEEDHRRLFETNFWGVVHGSLVAIHHLKQRGGALINLGSVLSDQAIPIQGMYSASKHAVKGFTDALRMELEAESAPVSVTLVKPAAINTPYPQHAKNYLDEEPSLPPPVYQPEEVARAILFAAAHPKRDLYIGSASKTMSVANRAMPRLMDRVSEKFMIPAQSRGPSRRDREGALHRQGEGGQMRGNAPGHVMRSSYYTRVTMHPVLTGTLLAAAGLTAATLLTRSRRNGR